MLWRQKGLENSKCICCAKEDFAVQKTEIFEGKTMGAKKNYAKQITIDFIGEAIFALPHRTHGVQRAERERLQRINADQFVQQVSMMPMSVAGATRAEKELNSSLCGCICSKTVQIPIGIQTGPWRNGSTCKQLRTQCKVGPESEN